MSADEPRFLNRELSWLEFNQRVLDEACDSSLPLLERLKFLAITASNLDEFFMVRVGGLQGVAESRQGKQDPAGLTAREQLAAISERTHEIVKSQYECFQNDIEPQMRDAGIRHLHRDELTNRQLRDLRRIFEEEIFAIHTPMAIDQASEFPLLPSLSLALCVRLAPAQELDDDDAPSSRFALIPFGPASSRVWTLSSEGGYSFLLLEDIIEIFVREFFPGEEVEEAIAFRISRNADMALREDQASDLLASMEEVLDERKQSQCVRLEVASDASDETLQFLTDSLDVAEEDVYLIPGPLNLSTYFKVADLQGFDKYRYESWPPQPNPQIDPTLSMFENITQGEILLCHPYDSFEPVVRFIEEAANDPDVLAIKQVLYRTSRNSPIVAALTRAAENGKNVTALVELKARFDEARNISWAKHLEQAGAQVIYGVKGLKTHAKICLVVRREPQGIQRYMHFGTGNYNEATARIYSDISFLTSDDDLGADATSFFNAIAGYSQPQQFRKLSMAPIGIRERLLDLIKSETQRKNQGQAARIVAKFNSLVDPEIIEALYEASQAGVKIQLNVRGICCLRPGVPGLSENILVTSIIDRFLEHARIIYFFQGGSEQVFISSADWMPRNLNKRVELLIPVERTPVRHRLIEILGSYFDDTAKASKLLPDGRFERIAVADQKRLPQRSQGELYRRACDAVRDAEQSQRTAFQPHRGPEAEA